MRPLSNAKPCSTPGLRPLFVALGAVAILAACGSDAPSAQPADQGNDAGGNQADGTIAGDGTSGHDGGADVGGSRGVDATGDVGQADDAGAEDAVQAEDGGSDTGTEADSGSADAGEADTNTTPDAGPKLPLRDCALKGGLNCDNCAETPMCLDGVTYKNDCEAILKLKAYDWPKGYAPEQGACPSCKGCLGVKLQCNKGQCEACGPKGCEATGDACKNETDCAWTPVCATLKSGAKVTVEVPCEASCLELATDVGINPKNGACKSKCAAQPPDGGGCPMSLWQPVCSKKDGNTYASECAMQNCAKQGCYAVGSKKSSAECTEDNMEIECYGECWDKDNKKWTDAGCTDECKPVCGITKGGRGQNFRNKCVAGAEGAKTGNCDGVSATAADKCSSQLYVDHAAPCCKDVTYWDVKPVCAALGQGMDALWYTFRNKAEFNCWDGKAKADAKANPKAPQWEFKYLGACICKCDKTDKPVCGADGLTYQNKCQAKCYGGEQFTWKDGACKS